MCADGGAEVVVGVERRELRELGDDVVGCVEQEPVVGGAGSSSPQPAATSARATNAKLSLNFIAYVSSELTLNKNTIPEPTGRSGPD